MDKILEINEKVKTHESALGGGLRGEVIFGTGKHEVEFMDPYGNISKRSEFDNIIYKDHNIIPIGAYQWIFSKIMNIAFDQETTLRVGDMNDEAPQMKIGVPRSRYKSIYYNAESNVGGDYMTPKDGVNIPATDAIFGFMIGDGGAREDNITAIAPDYKSRSLFRAIPFRMSSDGYELPFEKYYGKSDTFSNGNTLTSYYVKTFDTPSPRIIHAWVTNNQDELEIVDDTVFSSTSSLAIESYVEINFSLDEFDTRGFFSTTNSTPRVNEFALVSGWYNVDEDDYERIRMISHFCRPTISLADGDVVSGIYRIYSR